MSDYLEHITLPGERWDLLADLYYGDAKLMHHLLQANSELVGDPDKRVPLIFKAGITVRIPVLEQAQISAAQLPPWKRSSQ
jgi:hypothetical protein